VQCVSSSRHHRCRRRRAGIKRPKTHRVRSTKGMDPKFIRNARHALHGSREAAKKLRKVCCCQCRVLCRMLCVCVRVSVSLCAHVCLRLHACTLALG
jgi:large subunit ribosomal protein L29e